MMKELQLRKAELNSKKLSTIYFGGGTPSLLNESELNLIFETMHKYFEVDSGAEITLETNPDDLHKEQLRTMRSVGINRLSIGIQSFRDEDLKLMNRVHTSEEAISSIKRSQDFGIANLSIDLIYGIPELSNDDWKKNLEQALAFGVQHLSAYCLTVEPRTALFQLVKKGVSKPVNEEEASQHFEALMKFASENGFDHYEISNFAKEHFIARHNSSYWFGESYLGIGPSAHSFDGERRKWNVANNNLYISKLSNNTTAYEEELLNERERYNEMIMTGLRTKWGVKLEDVKSRFGVETLFHLEKEVQKWLDSSHLELLDGKVFTNGRGKLLADRIASDLFLV